MEEIVVRPKKKRIGKILLCVIVLMQVLAVAAYLLAPAQIQKRVRLELQSFSLPEDVVSLGRRNPEALDFVLGWKEGESLSYDASTIDLYKEYDGTIPLLLQWDARWGYADYGTNCVGLAGCAPTCISMVAIGLTGDTDINPLAVAQYSEEQGWYVPGVGTSWALLDNGGAAYGLRSEGLPIEREAMLDALDSGKYLIASMLPGDFTTAGHFIVISGYEDSGFHVLDPNSPARSEQLWGYTTLAPQIAALWAFST